MKQVVFEETLNGITIDRIIRDYEYNMPEKHVHEEYEIYYLLEGERYYFIELQSYHVKKGSLIFVNKRQIHKTSFTDRAYHDRILIELKEEPFGSFFSSMGDLSLSDFFNNYCGVLELDEKNQKWMERLLISIATEIHNKEEGYQLSVMIKLSQLLIFALRYHSKMTVNKTQMAPTYRHRIVDEVASYIIDNYNKVVSLQDLAMHFYVNKCYLSRIFKEVTGFTVIEYINIHRMQHAQKLLLNSNLSIADIANMVGYENITYFEKVFKKYTETSPLKYRKQNKSISPLIRAKRAEVE